MLLLDMESSAYGRSPCGERGLKFSKYDAHPESAWGRSPCGERGLKFFCRNGKRWTWRSLPVRGAWIEIFDVRLQQKPVRSLPVRGAWIEISTKMISARCGGGSLPVRGAWIEMLKTWDKTISRTVAPRAGSVD